MKAEHALLKEVGATSHSTSGREALGYLFCTVRHSHGFSHFRAQSRR